MPQTIYSIVIITIIVLLILSLLAFVFQRKLIYLPDRNKPSFAHARQLGMQEVSLQTKDGLKLLSWYKEAEKGKATMVYFHGNAGHIEYRLPSARYFIEQGLGVLLVEYRGYGGNPGFPSEQGLYSDGYSAIQFLQNKNIPLSQIVIYGESLGTGVAVEISRHYPTCALVLQSPFTSMFELAKWHYPWILIKPWDHFNSIEKIKGIQTPVLILHGSQDEIVPPEQAQRLFNATRSPKQIFLFPERGHQDIWGQEFYQKVILFINKHCPLSGK